MRKIRELRVNRRYIENLYEVRHNELEEKKNISRLGDICDDIEELKKQHEDLEKQKKELHLISSEKLEYFVEQLRNYELFEEQEKELEEKISYLTKEIDDIEKRNRRNVEVFEKYSLHRFNEYENAIFKRNDSHKRSSRRNIERINELGRVSFDEIHDIELSELSLHSQNNNTNSDDDNSINVDSHLLSHTEKFLTVLKGLNFYDLIELMNVTKDSYDFVALSDEERIHMLGVLMYLYEIDFVDSEYEKNLFSTEEENKLQFIRKKLEGVRRMIELRKETEKQEKSR